MKKKIIKKASFCKEYKENVIIRASNEKTPTDNPVRHSIHPKNPLATTFAFFTLLSSSLFLYELC